ncbi:transporter (CPA2 family) [Jatrophihabitans sp. GAS493]|uniref:cation:proton antiporter n=1 Tax=Jatrophihabitans sp. GAS493 TaxID=1907575 RepID=UPI000BB791BA|nr:cation:proton antiporter [Jatrophihabitans sp. GAS493]SOD74310.1 transporter (CPA2 family) [Jatrophihabitans sp. GAS493]
MTFSTLALIGVIALLGPLLALPAGWHLPVVLGELLAGLLFGATGLDLVHSGDATFTFLASIGFALVMFVAGSRVPVRDARLRGALRVGALRAVGVGLLSAGAAFAIARSFHTGHAGLYAVLIASSSAALVLPIVDSLRLEGSDVLALLAQVAIADTVCVVALPLAIDPAHAARAAVGAVVVLATSGLLFWALRNLDRSGVRQRVHRLSEDRKFALELRINLAILFALAALAVQVHVSIMLAGFCFGLAVAGVGEPRRLARQLFAITDGFLAPLFFVWLGASIDLGALVRHPKFIGLGVALGAAAILCHALMRLSGQRVALGTLAAAQLGVPVAAATLGTQLHLLDAGESAALLLGAVITIAAAILGGSLAARSPSRTGEAAS